MTELGTGGKQAEALVRAFFATLSTGDLDRVGQFFDDETVWAVNNVAAGHPSQHGRDNIIEKLLRPVREGLFQPGDPKIEVRRVIDSGSGWLAAETVGRGTLKNSRAYHNGYAWMIRVEGGTIKYLKEFMDTAYAAQVTEGLGRAGQGSPGEDSRAG